MRKNPPDYLMVLPWHFKKEIIERESEYLKNGGQLIFYFPTFEIISYKPKLLVTGCDGFIGNYLKKNYNDFQKVCIIFFSLIVRSILPPGS